MSRQKLYELSAILVAVVGANAALYLVEFGLTVSDWAAWAQTFGSITAVAVAIWVSRAELRSQAAERHAAKLEYALLYSGIVDEVLDHMRRAIVDVENGGTGRGGYLPISFAPLNAALEEISVERMPTTNLAINLVNVRRASEHFTRHWEAIVMAPAAEIRRNMLPPLGVHAGRVDVLARQLQTEIATLRDGALH